MMRGSESCRALTLKTLAVCYWKITWKFAIKIVTWLWSCPMEKHSASTKQFWWVTTHFSWRSIDPTYLSNQWWIILHSSAQFKTRWNFSNRFSEHPQTAGIHSRDHGKSCLIFVFRAIGWSCWRCSCFAESCREIEDRCAEKLFAVECKGDDWCSKLPGLLCRGQGGKLRGSENWSTEVLRWVYIYSIIISVRPLINLFFRNLDAIAESEVWESFCGDPKLFSEMLKLSKTI